MASIDIMALERLGKAFSPTHPILLPDLLSGRRDVLYQLQDDVMTPGQHVLLYGDRGVGKSSVARVAGIILQEDGRANGRRSIFVSCDSEDTYGSIWRKVFQEVLLSERQLGFEQHMERSNIIGRWNPADNIESPNDVRLLIGRLPNPVTIIIDEFDRIPHGGTTSRLMTDTIKLFSDSGTPCTIVLVGVGQSIEGLISAHQSISRNMDYVQVEPMPLNELGEIIQKGFQTAGLHFEAGLDDRIAQLSQGYPHYTHLLGLWSARRALERQSQEVTSIDLKNAIPSSIGNAAGGIRVEYNQATDSVQPNNLFRQVLLACALADKDVRGRFPLAALQQPLQKILNPRKIARSSYQRHLALFCEAEHGPVLVKTGRRKNYRWNFINPQLVPFVLLQGIKDGMITDW